MKNGGGLAVPSASWLTHYVLRHTNTNKQSEVEVDRCPRICGCPSEALERGLSSSSPSAWDYCSTASRSSFPAEGLSYSITVTNHASSTLLQKIQSHLLPVKSLGPKEVRHASCICFQRPLSSFLFVYTICRIAWRAHNSHNYALIVYLCTLW